MSEPIGEIDIDALKGDTFKEITMLQLKKVTELSNVEFRGGFYTTITTNKGEDKEVYVPDSRERFWNAIFALTLLMRPKFDKTMTKRYQGFLKTKNKIKKDFTDASTVDETIILSDKFYTEEKDKILLETYKNKMVDLHWYIFGNVCKLLARKKFFDTKREIVR